MNLQKPLQEIFGKLTKANFSRVVRQAFRHLQTMPKAPEILVHRFTGGLYSRELTVPKGCIAIGKLHKTRHQFVLLKGRLAVWTKDGVSEIRGGEIGITEAGTQRIVYAFEDSVFVCFHGTNETDLEKVEAEIIEPQMFLNEGKK